MRASVMQAYHNDELVGHFNHKKTAYLVRQKYYWPTMHKDIHKYCKTCEICQKNKHMVHKNIAKLQTIQVKGPFNRVGVDCVGPLTLTESGNKHIVVFIDYFTKYIEAFAVPDITALTIAKLFVQKIVCRHGAPTILQSDRGTDFTSKLMHEISKLMNTKQLHTTAYHPMCNGEVERANQTLIIRIRMYVNAGHTDWDVHLPFSVFATNINQNESTKYSPFELIYGRKPMLPIDAVLNYEKPVYLIDTIDYADQVKMHFTTALTIIQKTISDAQKKYSKSYDKKATDTTYKVGDMILKDVRYGKRGLTAKLLPTFEGPYEVIDVKYPNIIVKHVEKPNVIETLHLNRTRKFNTTVPNLTGTPEIRVDHLLCRVPSELSPSGPTTPTTVDEHRELTSSTLIRENERYDLRPTVRRTRTFEF